MMTLYRFIRLQLQRGTARPRTRGLCAGTGGGGGGDLLVGNLFGESTNKQLELRGFVSTHEVQSRISTTITCHLIVFA